MTGVKIVDKNPRAPRRRGRLWECFGRVGINPTDVKDARGAYYAILPMNMVEKLLEEEVKQTFKNEEFEILNPIEYNSLKSVIIRQVDRVILEYEDEEIIQSIQDKNNWAQVEQVHKLTASGRIIKIRFTSTEMAATAMREGLVVLNQFIPARNVEKEIYVKLNPCYNCYGYQHKTKDCDRPRTQLCAFCGEEGHRQQTCSAQNPCCINCGGPHRTLAAACPIRKDLIKNKSKDLRQRSRSRSRSRTAQGQQPQRQTTYADVINQQTSDIPNIDATEMKHMISTITVSIIYAQCADAITPGTFQQTIDTMFTINHIPKVKFPANQLNQGIKNLYEDMFNNMMGSNSEQQQQNMNQQRQQKQQQPQQPGPRQGELPKQKSAMGSTLDLREISINEPLINPEEVPNIGNQDNNKRPRDSPQGTSDTQERKKKHGNQPKPRRDSSRDTEERERRRREEEEERRGREELERNRNTNTNQGVKSKQSDPRSRDQMWIRIFISKSSAYAAACSNMEEKRELIKKAISKGEAKLHWSHPKISYEYLHYSLTRGKIPINEKMVVEMEDRQFVNIKHTNFET